MMLGCASQSCVWSGDKAGQRYQNSGGEAHRISFEHVSHRRCGDFHCFVYAFHWPSIWLHDATIHRILAKDFTMDSQNSQITYQTSLRTYASRSLPAPAWL